MADDPVLDGIKALERVIERWRQQGAEAELLSMRLKLGPPIERAEVADRLADYSEALLMAAGIAESNLMMFQEAVYLSAMHEGEAE